MIEKEKQTLKQEMETLNACVEHFSTTTMISVNSFSRKLKLDMSSILGRGLQNCLA